MKTKIIIRTFNEKYIDDLINIFILSIKNTCNNDYSNEQIEAWLSSINKANWIVMFKNNYTLIAFKDNTPIGFGDISNNNYLNMLYVHPKYQNRGIATLICDILEQKANNEITVDASITAKNFFLKRDYMIIKKQTVYRKGIAINNFKMLKHCTNSK